MRDTCRAAVPSVMCSAPPICRFVRPSATSTSTSCSRRVSRSSGPADSSRRTTAARSRLRATKRFAHSESGAAPSVSAIVSAFDSATAAASRSPSPSSRASASRDAGVRGAVGMLQPVPLACDAVPLLGRRRAAGPGALRACEGEVHHGGRWRGVVEERRQPLRVALARRARPPRLRRSRRPRPPAPPPRPAPVCRAAPHVRARARARRSAVASACSASPAVSSSSTTHAAT